MKTDDVLVKSSKIHNKGVFAARDFKVGEIVLRWDISNILSENEVSKMTDDDKRYITFLNDKYVLMQDPERFVNHSCDANTTAKQFCDIAKREIKKGEEITANYKEELPPDTYMKCNCGSPNCIGDFVGRYLDDSRDFSMRLLRFAPQNFGYSDTLYEINPL